MNYFNKTMAAVIIAGAMSLTSCVENEVAPEVKQMRAAQVAYLQASADLQAAQAESARIRNEYSEANNAILLATAQATLDADLAKLEVTLLEAQVKLKKQELLLAEAVAAMEKFIAEKGLVEAAGYLEEYTIAAGILNGFIGDQLEEKAKLAKMQLVLASGNSSWEITKERLERDLAKETGKLAAQQAALETLEEVAADPSTAEAEIDALVLANAELSNDTTQLRVDSKKALDAKTASGDARTAARTAISDYEAIQGEIDAQILLIEAKELAIEGQVETVETRTTELADADAELEKLEGDLADFEAALAPKLAAVVTAEDAHAEAEAEVEAALTPHKIAFNDFKEVAREEGYDVNYSGDNPYSHFSHANAAMTEAKNDMEDAQNTYDATIDPDADADETLAEAKRRFKAVEDAFKIFDAVHEDFKVLDKALSKAQDDLTEAETAAAAYQDDVDNATTAVDNATTAVDNATTKLEAAQKTLAEYENDLVELQEGDVFAETVVKGLVQLEAELAAAQTAYDDAIANMEELTADWEAKAAAHAAIEAEITAKSSMISENKDVIDVLDTYLEDINAAIADKRGDIEDTREEILEIEEAIAEEGVNEAKQQDKIAEQEAKIAKLDAEIEAQQALVDKWKALLDEALAGN